MYSRLYKELVAIFGAPESCGLTRIRLALVNLKYLAELPYEIRRRRSVAMFYLGVACSYLIEAQKIDVGISRQSSGKRISNSSIIGTAIREHLQPIIDSLSGDSPTKDISICKVRPS